MGNNQIWFGLYPKSWPVRYSYFLKSPDEYADILAASLFKSYWAWFAYFNSTTKTVINHKFSLENAFQEILYRIDNWINEGSGWIVELIESQYINISTYRPL